MQACGAARCWQSLQLAQQLLGTALLKAWRLRADPAARVALATLVFALVAMVSDISNVFTRPNSYWVVLWLPIGLIMGLRPPVEQPTTT